MFWIETCIQNMFIVGSKIDFVLELNSKRIDEVTLNDNICIKHSIHVSPDFKSSLIWKLLILFYIGFSLLLILTFNWLMLCMKYQMYNSYYFDWKEFKEQKKIISTWWIVFKDSIWFISLTLLINYIRMVFLVMLNLWMFA